MGLLVAAGWFWWASRTAPLTAEERQFVGWWTTPARGPDPKSLSPVWQMGVEYRADRTIRVRRENTKTGEVTFVVPDQTWRAANGELIESYPRPNRDIIRELRRADFRVRHEHIYEVVWQGPDRYTLERYKIPGFPPPDGRGWPVWTRTRCDPPADAQ